jgi:hypothetical protein
MSTSSPNASFQMAESWLPLRHDLVTGYSKNLAYFKVHFRNGDTEWFNENQVFIENKQQ